MNEIMQVLQDPSVRVLLQCAGYGLFAWLFGSGVAKVVRAVLHHGTVAKQ